MLFSHVQHYSQRGVVILTPSQTAICQQCSTEGMLFPHEQHYSQMGVIIMARAKQGPSLSGYSYSAYA